MSNTLKTTPKKVDSRIVGGKAGTAVNKAGAKEAPKADAKEAAKKVRRADAKAKTKANKALITSSFPTDEFKALSPELQAAIKAVVGTTKAGGGDRVTIIDTLKEIFPKVGVIVTEMDVFKKTKWGRGEMRKKVAHCLKKAEPADKLWISFNDDETEESWKLEAIGANNMPKDWATK